MTRVPLVATAPDHAQLPLAVHDVASVLDQVKPEAWSEHLAFVRVRDQEIGHLAAPPRTQANVDGAAENLYRASQIVGSKPHVENIATLLDPPGSTFSESEWAREILSASGCELLFDLHNVYANGTNHGWRPTEYLANIGAERIRYLHIAGGRFIAAPDGRNRILDDHLHSVPDPVYALLEDVAAVAPHPLTVILERDGDYPSIEQLLLQTRKAKTAMARGRVRRGITMETAA